MPARPPSIRWRLLGWLALLLGVLLAVVVATAYELTRITQLKQVDKALRLRVAALTSEVRRLAAADSPAVATPMAGGNGGGARRPPPPPPGGKISRPAPPPGGARAAARGGEGEWALSPEGARLFGEAGGTGHYLAIWLANDGGAKISELAGRGLMRPRPPSSDGPLFTRTRDSYREMFFYTERGDCVLAGVSIERAQAELRRLGLGLALAAGAVLAAGLGGMGWLVGRALRPVESIGATAERIAAGNLSERIDAAQTEDELGRLARVLNATFARLEAAFARQKNFTADASHELRTPLTVIVSETQATLAREHRTEAEYREALEVCLGAAQRMQRLSEALLELARFDAGQEPVRRAPGDWAEIARGATEGVALLAKTRGVRVSCDLAPAPLAGDAGRLAQVATNLLTNAIHHSRTGGEVKVTTRATPTGATLAVADEGDGIATEDLPHVFERFYRGDKARARAEGRSGLGLAIAKAIVDAHGGTITVVSTEGEGATFTVQLPS